MEVRKWDGKPISKPGWYSNVPIEKYHSAGICVGKAVSSSNLRRVWTHSEAHMNAEWCENPEAEPRDPSRSMILGQAAHHLFLGEDDYNMKFVVNEETYPDKKTGEPKKWTYAADYCKNWRDKQEALGLIIVTPEEVKTIKGMAASLLTQALVQQGLLRGYVETSGFFFDRESALWIKVRPDVIPTDSGDFADLKTAREVTTPALMSALRELAYPMQGALIWQACNALGMEFRSFNLLFVETSAPYCARAHPLEHEDLSLAHQQNRSSLIKIRRAIDLKRFPGPSEDDHYPIGQSYDERERIKKRLKLEGLL